MNQLDCCDTLSIEKSSICVLENEGKNRTFIGLEVSEHCGPDLREVVSKVDLVLSKVGLQAKKFYSEP